DGNRIAAVEINLSNENFLIVLDAENGEEIIRIPSPENKMLSSLSFEKEDKVLAVTRTSNGSGIVEFSLTDGNSTVLLSEQIQQIESPSYVKDKVLFKANYN